MAEDPRMDEAAVVRKSLAEADPDVLRSMAKAMAEALMAARATAKRSCSGSTRERGAGPADGTREREASSGFISPLSGSN